MKNIHIMMATYNGEKYVAEQIESILNQTYTNWKLYISDDLSSDGTVKIIKKYSEKYPDKIILMDAEIKKGGAAANFAFLFNNVPKADYYMFSDQDDKWKNTKIEKSIKKIRDMENQGKKNNLVYCNAELVDGKMNSLGSNFVDNNKLVFKEDNRSAILVYNFAPGAAMFFDNGLFEIISKIPLEAFIHDWYCMIFGVYFGNVSYIDECLYYYRQHEDNVYGARDKITIRWLIKYFKENSIFGTMKELLGKFKKLQLMQYKVINKIYSEYDSKLNKKSKEIMYDYMSLFTTKSKIKKIRLIIKNEYYLNRSFDTLLFILTICGDIL